MEREAGTIATTATAQQATQQRLEPLPPLCVDPSQLVKVTVCTRPFRAAGPRLETERLGDKLVVHNYGHGGSGWSLSWGSAAAAVSMALHDGDKEIAVIGCGALGLTSAIALQWAGAQVTIYARDLPTETRSARATGVWTPDARIALTSGMASDFPKRWEALARHTHRLMTGLLDAPEQPLDIHHRFVLSDIPATEAWAQRLAEDDIGFARLEDRLHDLFPEPVDFGPGQHPFTTRYARQTTSFRYNIAALTRHLGKEYRERGGTLVQQQFHTPGDLLQLHERVIVHCTGYGARALFGDDSLIPVRGQISWLPPQPGLPYSLQWGDLNLVPRADGTVVQWGAQGDSTGWNDASEAADPEETRSALAVAVGLCGAPAGDR